MKEFNNSNKNPVDKEQPLSKILSILNKHHQNLMWLDEQSKEIKVKIGRLNDELKIQNKWLSDKASERALRVNNVNSIIIQHLYYFTWHFSVSCYVFHFFKTDLLSSSKSSMLDNTSPPDALNLLATME